MEVNASAPAIATSKTGGVPWTQTDYNNVVNFCQNVSLTSTVSAGTTAYASQTGVAAPTIAPPPAAVTPVDQNVNLARLPGTVATQSSTYTGWPYYPAASLAIDGSTAATNAQYGLTLTAASAEQWWQVDLGDVKSIGTIKIYRLPSGADFGNDCPFDVFVTNSDPGTATLATLASVKGQTQNSVTSDTHVANPGASSAFGTNGSNFMTINLTGVSGRFVRVARNSASCPYDNGNNDYLGLAEVEVYPGVGATGGAGASGPAISLTDSSDPTVTNNNAALLAGSGQFATTLTLLSSQAETGLKARVKLLGYNPDGTLSGTPLQLSSTFKTLNITESATNSPINILEDIPVGNVVTYDNNLSLSANTPETFAVAGLIPSIVVRGKYALVSEITDATGNVVVSDTTTFNIQ